MSNERQRPDDVSDRLVSRAYRELADERTPEHLDHVVLNAARNAGKARHRNAMAWLRPAAWVTTIGLSLAIVLEVADMPQQDHAIPAAPPDQIKESSADVPAASPAVEAKSETAQQSEADVADAQKSMQKLQRQATDAEVGRFELESAVDVPETNTPEPATARQDAAPAIETDSLNDPDRNFLREAENRARLQAGSDEEVEELFIQAAPAAGIASEAAMDRYCDESLTTDPNTWLECILDLEQRGLHDEAHFERELLKEAFPAPIEP